MNYVYVAIQKNRTEIWKSRFKKCAHPYRIYAPSSIPGGISSNLATASSTRDVTSTRCASKTFRLIPSWMKPDLEDSYQKRIYDSIKGFDKVYLVGSGVGRWSGINNFMRYIRKTHPEFLSRIHCKRQFRFSDFPPNVLHELFKEMS